MLIQSRYFSMSRLVLVLTAFAFGNLLAGVPQNGKSDEDQTKDVGRIFRNARLGRQTTTGGKRKKSPPATGAAPTSQALVDLVGVTLWQLRPQKADGEETKLLKHNAAEITNLIAERVDLGSPLSNGSRVRMTLETPREGYLYVVDREQYADGSFGDPVLIFPTTRIRGGDNKLVPGTPIGIPSLEDNPPYFVLERSRPNHLGEAVSLIITSQPIEGVEIGQEAVKLSKEKFAGWQQWEVEATQIKVGATGALYTKTEKTAEGNRTKSLRQGDPLPQTVYQISGKAGSPFMMKIPLKIEK